ncbi:hypothetical protein GCM10027321_28270 [Massilia terrae]|uniref:Sigma-70 family RNA polymerase sigma factor n=1 Tax=Massilia terrae TaxID=1811224 RepID=A0ABT2D0P5_9BURK|nr:hypothetical protein [Massilia terrae]MCS0659775.1 hypothetical protein [Massilia terrae]
MNDSSDTHASQDEIFEAVATLSRDELRLIDYWANKLAFGTVYADGMALFDEAIERALDGRRKWDPAKMSFVEFVRNTMASLSNNDRTGHHARTIANVSALVGDVDVSDDEFLSAVSPLPKNSVEDTLLAQEEREALLRDYDALYAHFSDDEEVFFILGAMEQGLIGSKIKAHCNLSDKQYVAARKRLDRGVAKLKAKRENHDHR